MEVPLSGFLKIKIKVALGLEKFDVMPEKINDWQINQVNDDQIPKLKINTIKLNPKGKIIIVEQEQVDWRLQTESTTPWHPGYVAEKLWGDVKWELE